MAWEWIFTLGADFRLGDTGITGMVGKAHVTFTNLSTKESFSEWYDIVTINSFGLNAFIGGSAGFTCYAKYFPDGSSKNDVLTSYEGIFANITCPQLSLTGGMDFYGVSASETLVIGVDPKLGFFGKNPVWMGFNAAISFNAVSLLPGPGIKSYSVSYSIYKLHEIEKDGKRVKTNWSDLEYEQYFFGARLLSNQLKLSDLPKLVEDAKNNLD